MQCLTATSTCATSAFPASAAVQIAGSSSAPAAAASLPASPAAAKLPSRFLKFGAASCRTAATLASVCAHCGGMLSVSYSAQAPNHRLITIRHRFKHKADCSRTHHRTGKLVT